MKIYQVLNKDGYPASSDTNPLALFESKQQTKDFITYLVEDCGADFKKDYSIKPIISLSDIVK